MKNACFFNKISAFEQTQFCKTASSVWNLICVLQTSIVKTSIVGRIEILCLKIDMTCKIENGFYWLFCFHYQYFRTQKLKNVVFQIKRHVWADTVFKCGCIHTETLLREIGTGFYWLVCFDCWKIRKSCFWSKIIFLRRNSFEK